MQETLNHPYKILKAIAARDLTGCLTFSIPNDDSVGWQLYVGGNRLYYATATTGQKERLACLWKQMRVELSMPEIQPNGSEYESLCDWYRASQVSLGHFRQILLNVSREGLIHALSHDRVSAKFETNACIKQTLIAPPLNDLIKTSLAQARSWQALHPEIPSPFSRPYLDGKKVDEFRAFWHESCETLVNGSSLEVRSCSTLIEILEQKLSFYQIASSIDTEPRKLATWMHPLIKKGTIAVLPYQTREESQKVRHASNQLIACIDDSQTVQRQVKMTLEMAQYQVLSITDPATSLTTLARNKPALILMDINMPEIDGYELCRMLRQSRHLKDIPIVMFTGRDGIIDRVRAQLAGAVDYITKPVEADILIAKVRELIEPVVEGERVLESA